MRHVMAKRSIIGLGDRALGTVRVPSQMQPLQNLPIRIRIGPRTLPPTLWCPSRSFVSLTSPTDRIVWFRRTSHTAAGLSRSLSTSEEGDRTPFTGVGSRDRDTNSIQAPYIDWRPMTLHERAIHFTPAIKQLYRDILRSSCIDAAAETPINAWNRRRIQTFPGSMKRIRENNVPRRQQEQQRRLRQDLTTTLPICILFCVPILGYSAFLSLAFPRQLLGRQFHNRFEIRHYALVEYEQRMMHVNTLTSMLYAEVLSSAQIEQVTTTLPPPVFPDIQHLITIFSIFSDVAEEANNSVTHRATLASLEDRPHAYLVELALFAGAYQNLTPPLNSLVARMMPSLFLKDRIMRLAVDVALDDCALLDEMHDRSDCMELTDEEVQDACLARVIPITGSVDDSRQLLTEYLRTMRILRQHFPRTSASSFGMFSLHLPLLLTVRNGKM